MQVQPNQWQVAFERMSVQVIYDLTIKDNNIACVNHSDDQINSLLREMRNAFLLGAIIYIGGKRKRAWNLI